MWSDPNEYYQTLADIQANTPWEAHGVEGNPLFWDYDADDHDLCDGSWPAFYLTAASTNALDRGTTALPDSLIALLDAFDVTDSRRGEAYDIGRYEAGFALVAEPPFRIVPPGGEAHYALSLHASGLPHTVTVTATSPSPILLRDLSSPFLAPGSVVTLTVTDTHTISRSMPTLVYTVPIMATGADFADTTSVRLYVGGMGVYLPVALHDE
jgi:hypothetical protein